MTEQTVVVGAGPTGLTLACLLLKAGAPVRVVDAADGPTTRSRAIGVSARSLEVLREIGVADQLVDRGLPSRRAVFYADGRPVGGLTTAATRDTRYPFLLAVPQSATEEVLETRLVELGGEVERSTRLTGLRAGADSVELTLSTGTVTAGWVVGADGSHSVVRRDAGIPFSGAATGKVFANVDTTLDPQPEAGVGHYCFAPGGMLVIAPLPGGIYRVTASLDPADTGRELTLANVQDLIDRRGLPGITVRTLQDAGWGVARISIQTRIADRFRAGRCLLAGDAAHIYGPTGAQGMNGGIQDAHDLAWRLALVLSGRGRDSLLDEYAAERRRVSEGVLHHVEQQTTMATVRPKPAVAARNAFLGFGTRVGLLDRGLTPTINQLDVRYARPRPDRRGLGRRLPDVPLAASRTLFEALAERPFTLLACGPAAEAQVAALAAAVRRRPYADLVQVRTIRTDIESPGDLYDVTGRLHRFLGARRTARVALVRPDQHVAAVAGPAHAAELLRHLDALLTDAVVVPPGTDLPLTVCPHPFDPPAGAGVAAESNGRTEL